MVRFITVVLAIVLPATFANGATLSSSGITDLDVEGTLYDVQFLNGSCNDHFDCMSNDGFDFDDAGAEAAIQAIADLFNLPENMAFNQDPSLIDGCLLSTFCTIIVPTSFSPENNTFSGWTFTNRFPSGNLVGQSSFLTGFDGEQEVFASFSLSNPVLPPSEVPLPATAVFLLAGLGALSMVKRGKKASTT